MDENTRQLHGSMIEIRNLRLSIHPIIARINSHNKDNKTNVNMNDIADLIWVLKRYYSLIDDFRKDLGATLDLANKILGVSWLLLPDELSSIDGDISQITPRVSTPLRGVSFTKDYERYEKVLKAFGVPEDIIKTGVLNIHWVHAKEWLSNQLHEGKHIPEGIRLDETYVEYKSTVRTKKEVDESDEENISHNSYKEYMNDRKTN